MSLNIPTVMLSDRYTTDYYKKYSLVDFARRK